MGSQKPLIHKEGGTQQLGMDKWKICYEIEDSHEQSKIAIDRYIKMEKIYVRRRKYE